MVTDVKKAREETQLDMFANKMTVVEKVAVVAVGLALGFSAFCVGFFIGIMG